MRLFLNDSFTVDGLKLKNKLKQTKELLQSEKEKMKRGDNTVEKYQDKLQQAEQEKEYVLTYQKKVENCWDVISVGIEVISLVMAVYFGDWIKVLVKLNLVALLLLVQAVYVGIRAYVKGCKRARGYY